VIVHLPLKAAADPPMAGAPPRLAERHRSLFPISSTPLEGSMNTRKIIAASAVALALLTFAFAVVQLSPSHPEPVSGGGTFSARFQPQLDVLAGIGSTRDLTPVEMGDLKPAQPARAPSRTQASTDGGRRATAEGKR